MQGKGIRGSNLGVGDGQCEQIWGTDLRQENEWKLEDLREEEGCKGEGIKVLLRTGDEVGIKTSSWSER